jgi:hypothetical protein
MGFKNQNVSRTIQTPYDPKYDPSMPSASATATTLGIDDTSAELSAPDVEKRFQNADHPQRSLDRNEHSNIINWDGSNDPDMPLNWPARKKWTTILLLATLTLLTCVCNLY